MKKKCRIYKPESMKSGGEKPGYHKMPNGSWMSDAAMQYAQDGLSVTQQTSGNINYEFDKDNIGTQDSSMPDIASEKNKSFTEWLKNTSGKKIQENAIKEAVLSSLGYGMSDGNNLENAIPEDMSYAKRGVQVECKECDDHAEFMAHRSIPMAANGYELQDGGWRKRNRDELAAIEAESLYASQNPNDFTPDNSVNDYNTNSFSDSGYSTSKGSFDSFGNQIADPYGEVANDGQLRNAHNYADSWNNDKPWGTKTPEQEQYKKDVETSYENRNNVEQPVNENTYQTMKPMDALMNPLDYTTYEDRNQKNTRPVVPPPSIYEDQVIQSTRPGNLPMIGNPNLPLMDENDPTAGFRQDIELVKPKGLTEIPNEPKLAIPKDMNAPMENYMNDLETKKEERKNRNSFNAALGIIGVGQLGTWLGEIDERNAAEAYRKERESRLSNAVRPGNHGDYMANVAGVGDYFRPDEHLRKGYNTKIARDGTQVQDNTYVKPAPRINEQVYPFGPEDFEAINTYVKNYVDRDKRRYGVTNKTQIRNRAMENLQNNKNLWIPNYKDSFYQMQGLPEYKKEDGGEHRIDDELELSEEQIKKLIEEGYKIKYMS